MTILITGIIIFRTSNIISDKEKYFLKKRGPIHQEVAMVLYMPLTELHTYDAKTG